jgi:hypothetical protein
MTPTTVFQSLWLGQRLSPLEHTCIKSFLAHGHQFVLYAYEPVDNLPPACQVEDARAIVSEAEVFESNPLGFSDLFRYELLRTRGGWWVDTDVLCLTRDIPETQYAFAREDEQYYNGAVFKAPADSRLIAEALRRARQAGTEVAANAIGPHLLTELIRELGLEREAQRREDFYPVRWDQVLEFLDPAKAGQIETRTASSTFVHFYSNMLRSANVLMDARPPQGSYLDRIYVAYDIEFPVHPRYEWSDIESQHSLEQNYWRLSRESDELRAEVQRLRAKADERTQAIPRAIARLVRRGERP